MPEVRDVTSVKKLQIQLGIPFFILMGIVIGVLIFGTLYFGSSFGGGNGGPDPQKLARDGSVAISSYISERVSLFENILNGATDVTTNPGVENTLRDTLSSNRDILTVALFDNSGNQILELHKSRASKEVLDRGLNGKSYLGVLKGRVEPYIVFSPEITPSILAIAVPKRVSDELDMFIVVSIEGEYIESVLSSLGGGEPVKAQLLEQRTAKTIVSKSTLVGVSSVEGPTIDKVKTIFETGKQEFGYDTESGVTVVAAWEPVLGTSWNLVTHTLPGELSTVGIGIFVAGTMAILLVAAAGFFYLSVLNAKLITPLKKIEKAMHYYRTGDYSEEIKIQTKNEFAAIAELLNNMARNIENNTSERVMQLKKVLDRQNTDTRLLIEKDVELRETGKKLKELDAAKSMFVSVAAHQMRTPLAAVKWSIKLVMDGDVGPVNAEQKEYLQKGYDSTTRMIGLINDLLDVDKIESDKFTYEFKEESLVDMLQGIVDDLTPISNDKGVNLIFDHEKDEKAKISADRVKLTNALQNLIDNAIKYTIGGGDVTVKLKAEKEVFKVSVSDTGIGIPISEQSKVFGKFFRAKNAVRQQTDGSGLGLFIVKKIIEKHGGSVVFESKEKIGTTFFIEVPVPK